MYNLKKGGKDFYLDFNHSMINDYGVITKNIGESGANIIKGNAEIMIRLEAVAPDLVRWRCIVYGNGLSESSIPNQCILGSSVFFKILKDNNMISAEENFDLNNNPLANNDWGELIKITRSLVIGQSLVVMKRLSFGITSIEYLIAVIMLQS